MPTSERRINYQFHVSDEAFRMIVLAIAARSLATQKLETLSSVVEYVASASVMPREVDISRLSSQRFDGDIRVSLSIKGTSQSAFDSFRQRLGAASGTAWAARELALAGCFSVVDENMGLR